MASADAREEQLLRAYVDTRKREVQQAERAFDVQGAACLLEQLSRPLTHPKEFNVAWQCIYIEHFYRDVAKFVLTFVSVHLLPGFDEAQRKAAFDAFFTGPHIPAFSSISTLIAQISVIKLPASSATSARSDPSADEAAQVLAQSVRLLECVLEANGFRRIVEQLRVSHITRGTRSLLVAQPAVSSLCSVPDLVYNRLQRATPKFFSPRGFHRRLCSELLGGLLTADTEIASMEASAAVFRMFSEKLARIGQLEHLVGAWLGRQDLYDSSQAAAHSRLLGALPISPFDSFLLQLANAPPATSGSDGDFVSVVSAPHYLLLSLLPADLCTNKQFQSAVAHKLVLAKPVRDFVFLRVLIDTLNRPEASTSQGESPLVAVLDVVVNRWSGDAFPVTADYGLNASMCFFLRYAMSQMHRDVFEKRDWTMKLCKGVQIHMAHSVERVRLLGMRVGESVSKIMSPEQLLDFEISEIDPLEAVSSVQFDFSLPIRSSAEISCEAVVNVGANGPTGPDDAESMSKSTKKFKKKPKGLAFVDPDEVVDSDNDAGGGEKDDDNEASDSDSDASLEAYDLNDDEDDLKAPRPVYLKDLLAALHAEDERDRTETALAEAESLLRRKPKDLHFTAKAVVTALLRLEDKYTTPNFALLRAKGLAAACALSPASTIPYLQRQALEREQLLQSRLDVLQAMTSAAQELSETGAFRPTMTKNLLHEDLETRTMQGLKTRRFGYRRDPLAPAKKNMFADHAIAFFSPLLFGYVEYVRSLEGTKRLSEVEDVFLAHLLHALSGFVECAGHAPPAVPMAKGLMEFAWHYRTSGAAAVRRQVLYAFSRVLLVMPPFMLRQELGQNVMEMMVWLQETNKRDPDEGCREASRLLLSSGAVPLLTMP